MIFSVITKTAGTATIALLVILLIAAAAGIVKLTIERGIAALVSLLMLRAAQHADSTLETAASAGSVISAVLAFII